MIVYVLSVSEDYADNSVTSIHFTEAGACAAALPHNDFKPLTWVREPDGSLDAKRDGREWYESATVFPVEVEP